MVDLPAPRKLGTDAQPPSQARQPTPRGTTWPPCGLRTPAAPLVIDSDLRTDTAQKLGYGESRVSIQNYMDGTAIAHGSTEQPVEYRNSQQDSPMTKHQVT